MQHSLITALINALLDQQNHLKIRLAQHAGRTFVIVPPDNWLPDLHFSILAGGRVACTSERNNELNPDLRVELLGWPGFPLSHSALKASVNLEGHAGLADSLAFIASQLDLKPGDFLQPIFGDVLAHRADKLFLFLSRPLRT